MTRAREKLFAIVTPMLSVLFCLVMAEIVLHFLPVTTGLRSMPVTATDPIFHFEPNRNYVFSHGWRFENVNHGRVNNAGWVNDQDYDRNGSAPLIAIVGDSFIEAQMVPYAQTIQARMAAALAGRFRVYSFAGSGAPLSQYLIWVRHAVEDYGAKAVVINVVANDFDESHVAYKSAPGFWLYAPDRDGVLHLKLFEHRRGLLWSLAQRSALARYLLINLKLNAVGFEIPVLRNLFLGRPAMAATPGEFAAERDAQRMKISYAVIDAFFRDVPQFVALPPQRIVFTLDGFHEPQAAAAGVGSYLDRMRQAFRARGQALGYEVIDLQPFFLEHLQRTGDRVDFANDLHWNGTGHAAAAKALLSSSWLAQLGWHGTVGRQ